MAETKLHVVGEEKRGEELTIDIAALLQAILKRVWAVILAALICGAAAFGYSAYYVTPKYESSALLFVNSGTLSLDTNVFSIGTSSNTTLVDTYLVIIKTRMTLEQVIEDAGLSYSYEELYNMISASSVNDTSVLQVTITAEDPDEASMIANSLATVLQQNIAFIVDGSSVRVVDYAVPDYEKVSPNITIYTMVGALTGAMLVCLIVAIDQTRDNGIHSSNDLSEGFDIPVLVEIPDLVRNRAKSYSKKGYGYGYGYGYGSNSDESKRKKA